MARRGSKGLGSARQRPDGRWEYRFTAADSDGIHRQVSVYGATQKEAISKSKKLQDLYAKGLVAKKDKRTFDSFAQEWLERKKRAGKATNTISNYRAELNHIKPVLGDLKLQAIKPTYVRRLLDKLEAEGRKPRTLRKVLERVRTIMNEALKLELIYRNPADPITVEVPQSEPVGQTLQPEEVEALLKVCEDDTMGLLFRLVLNCGLRKGEALGLQWQDIDFEQGEMSITKNWTKGEKGRGAFSTPKTRKSKRVVPIPHGLLQRLKVEYQELLKNWKPEEIKALYLFGIDKPFQPDSPNHALRRFCEQIRTVQKKLEKETGVKQPTFPHIRVHDLRHTYGSLMLSKGIPLELVSERMGHANPTITLNVYRHLLENERRGYVMDIEEIISNRPRATA